MRHTLVLVLGCLLLLAGCNNTQEPTVAPTDQLAAESDQLPTVERQVPRIADDVNRLVNSCDHGRLVGEWIRDDLSGTSGHLGGIWIDQDNDTTGYFSATFEWTNQGFGYINGSISGYITDQVIAYVRGMFYYDDRRLCPMCGTSHGVFAGVFVNQFGDGMGLFYATFGDLELPPQQNTMPFEGRWAMLCNSAVSVAP